ncbi:hypothetical protein ACFQ1S_01465 [Kibdelosporangium lantanae]|uniref:DUF4760 domain-containing protein n=1 Tax=Kibdelosporangium lantanae TaxID=1497396 RepID=A0ABW3M2L6_9PSEU
MKTDVILDILPIFISTAALAVAVVSMRRQWRTARNANTVAAILKLFEEYRADDLRLARRAVFQMMDYSTDSTPALRDLPEDIRVSAERVSHYFDHVGLLVGHHLVPAKPMISFFGLGCAALWDKLEPYVVAERNLRTVGYYLRYFESFAMLSRKVDAGNLVESSTVGMRSGKTPLE